MTSLVLGSENHIWEAYKIENSKRCHHKSSEFFWMWIGYDIVKVLSKIHSWKMLLYFFITSNSSTGIWKLVFKYDALVLPKFGKIASCVVFKLENLIFDQSLSLCGMKVDLRIWDRLSARTSGWRALGNRAPAQIDLWVCNDFAIHKKWPAWFWGVRKSHLRSV